jgi:hypothetical protein
MTKTGEDDYIEAINIAIFDAGKYMDMDDVDATLDNEAHELAYEERYHCGTCVVRSVLEQIWPPLKNYIDFLSEKDD